MIKVCYFTSKTSSDIRVFEKECTSLVKAGFQVSLISPNAKNEIKNGVKIIGVPFHKKGLIARLFKLPRLLYTTALSVNADIYHFNDPASLFYGSLLKRRGKKVIFDSFEDHPSLILEHKFLPFFIRKMISKIYTYFEYYNCKNFDALIFCYHWSQSRLMTACNNNALIFNFPIINEDHVNNQKIKSELDFSLCYAGLFSDMWNIENILSALKSLDKIKFNLAGHGSDSIIEKFSKNEGWGKVNYFGKLNHDDVNKLVYSKSSVGMALLDYIPLCKGNVGNLSNNKFFEYLLSGLPIICTDFILWKEIIDNNNCGICVNPRSVSSIAEAIKYLVDNPEIAFQMGQNGRKAVIEKYNWTYEEKKLINLYKNILA